MLSILSLISTQAHSSDDAIEAIGLVLEFAILVSAWGLTYKYDDAPGRVDFYQGLGAMAGTTLLLNVAIDKSRPDGTDSDAFPSGHMALATYGAAFIQTRYGWKYGLPAYLLAAFVGWSRVEVDKHDSTDVIAGAAIGIASAAVFTEPYGNDVRLSAWHESDIRGLRIDIAFR